MNEYSEAKPMADEPLAVAMLQADKRPSRGRTLLMALIPSTVVGALLWAASPWFTGKVEPWDADAGARELYYPLALIAGGFVCCLLAPCRPVAIYAGLFTGQAAYALLFLPSGPFLALGLVILAVFTALSGVGVMSARLVLFVFGRLQLSQPAA